MKNSPHMKAVSPDCFAQIEELEVFEQPDVETAFQGVETKMTEAMAKAGLDELGGMMGGMMGGDHGSGKMEDAMGGLKDMMSGFLGGGRRRLLQMGSGKKDMRGMMGMMGDKMGSGKEGVMSTMMEGMGSMGSGMDMEGVMSTMMTEVQPKLDEAKAEIATIDTSAAESAMKASLGNMQPKLSKCSDEDIANADKGIEEAVEAMKDPAAIQASFDQSMEKSMQQMMHEPEPEGEHGHGSGKDHWDDDHEPEPEGEHGHGSGKDHKGHGKDGEPEPEDGMMGSGKDDHEGHDHAKGEHGRGSGKDGEGEPEPEDGMKGSGKDDGRPDGRPQATGGNKALGGTQTAAPVTPPTTASGGTPSTGTPSTPTTASDAATLTTSLVPMLLVGVAAVWHL